MATRLLSEDRLVALRELPEIGTEDPAGFSMLTDEDVDFIGPGRGRGPTHRLGLAMQLYTLPWLGFVPVDVAAAPPVAVARLAARLGVDRGTHRGGR